LLPFQRIRSFQSHLHVFFIIIIYLPRKSTTKYSEIDSEAPEIVFETHYQQKTDVRNRGQFLAVSVMYVICKSFTRRVDEQMSGTAIMDTFWHFITLRCI